MLRKIFYIICIIFIIIICLWYFVLKPRAQDIIFSELTKVAPTLKKDELKVFPTGFQINSSFSPALLAVPLDFVNPGIKLDLLSLLSLKPAINFHTQLLDGQISAIFHPTSNMNQLESKISLKDIKLSQHPTFRLIGFSTGLLNAEALVNKLTNQPGQVPDIKLNLNLDDLNIASANKLPAFISKYPIKIPAFSTGKLVLKANCHNNSCKTDALEFSSSLGEIKGQAEINLLAVKPQYNLVLDFALTKSGKEQLLPYLALVNQRLMDNPDRLFTLKVQGNSNSSNVSVVAK